MFDQSMYNNYVNAAFQILKDNLHRFGKNFADEFMIHHDPQKGQIAHTGMQNMYNNVTQILHNMSNGTGQYNTDMLFQAVGQYITAVYDSWLQKQNQTRGFGGGGFGTSGGFGRSTGFSSGGGFGSGGFGTPRPTVGTHFIDSTLESTQPISMQQTAPMTTSATVVVPEVSMAVFSDNPIEHIDDNTSFNVISGSPNWGSARPSDESISLMKRSTIKTPDEKINISVCDGFNKTYFDNPMDVVRDFFRVVPDQFLAEHFIFRLYYNHVERIDISTLDFLEARNKFVDGVTQSRGEDVYRIILGILDSMVKGPSKALSDYLLRHINRALELSLGMAEFPVLRIKFTQIEDLDELMGTNFKSKLLEVPHAKEKITTIVNTAILNALSAYSDVMFTDQKSRDIDIIRSSKVFPHSIFKVYPNKAVIPSSGTPGADKFFEAMEINELSKRTYVRSIRSVLITNILGGKALGSVTDKPTLVQGKVPNILNQYLLNHQTNLSIDPLCREYDIHDDQSAEEEYRTYLENPGKYEMAELSKIADFDSVKLPVDQNMFVIQYKTSPHTYLGSFDLVTVMDHPKDRPFTLLAKSKVADLKITN